MGAIFYLSLYYLLRFSAFVEFYIMDQNENFFKVFGLILSINFIWNYYFPFEFKDRLATNKKPF